MSVPQGAKQISHIEFNNLFYLNDTQTSLQTVLSDDFTSTGKPLNNLTTNTVVDAFFLNTIKTSLEENINVYDKFIFTFPKVLELDEFRDLNVTGSTVIDAVFVSEGASMMNMFGYYFYTVDVDGTKLLLDNSDSNIDSTDGYYRPTVIFPHVKSESNNQDTLQLGDMRRLKGNNVNGSFENIYVGFFLVPNGWYVKNGTGPYYNDAILYTTIDFCYNYTPTEYQMVTDKIYSVYAKAKSEHDDELLLVAFEDVFYSGVYNMDYNDCVVGFNISDVSNIANYDNFSSIVLTTEDTPSNNIVFIDSEGEYINISHPVFNQIDSTINYIFERHITVDSTTVRDELYDTVLELLTNFSIGVEKSGDKTVIARYLFRKNDIKNATKKSTKKLLYLLQVKYNNSKRDKVNDYQIMIGQNLIKEGYSESYRFYPQNNDQVGTIVLTDNYDKPVVESGDFRIIGNGVMDCIKGKSHLPFKDVQIYKVYRNINTSTNKGLVINIKMDNHPSGYMVGKKTFVMWVSFHVNGNDLVTVNLDTLDIYDSNMTINNNLSYDTIKISDKQSNSEYIKDLISVFRNDSGATYRTVTVNNYLVFYCIRFPNIKNNPTMVYLDSTMFINWDNAVNITDGTYFNKQTFYPIDNFTDY